MKVIYIYIYTHIYTYMPQDKNSVMPEQRNAASNSLWRWKQVINLPFNLSPSSEVEKDLGGDTYHSFEFL